MSRHRIVRSMNYSDEYDGYEDVYGHSVEDDYSMSPSDAAFMYDRSNREPARISSFLTTEKDIEEEDETDASLNDGSSVPERRDSQSSIRQHLSDIDEARLRSCLDEVRNVIGDSLSENILVDTILRSEFDVTRALDELLSSPQKSKKGDSPKPQRIRSQHQKDKQDEDTNISFTIKSTNSSKSSGKKVASRFNECVGESVFDSTQKFSFGSNVGSRQNQETCKEASKLFPSLKKRDDILDFHLDTASEKDSSLNDFMNNVLSLSPSFSKFQKNEIDTPSLSEVFAVHKKANEVSKNYSDVDFKSPVLTPTKSNSFGEKLNLTSALCSSSETRVANKEMKFSSFDVHHDKEDVSSGLSSLSSFRLKKNLLNDVCKDEATSNDAKQSPSCSNINISLTDAEVELKTLSLSDLLMRHKTETVTRSDEVSNNSVKSINSPPSENIASLTPDVLSSSFSELYLKHKSHNLGCNPISKDLDDCIYETERSSSLSKLAKRYKNISVSHSDDCSVDSGSVGSLLELAVRHRSISMSEEDVQSNGKRGDSSLASSASDVTSTAIGSLPNKFKMLKIDTVEDGFLSKSLPETVYNHNFNVMCERPNEHTLLNNFDSAPKKQVNIDLTCALQSPDKERSLSSKNRSDHEQQQACSPSDKLYLVDFNVRNVGSEHRMATVKCEPLPLISTLVVGSLQDKQLTLKFETSDTIKQCSPFGKVLCKKFASTRISYIPLTEVRVKSDVVRFNFSSTSPDDKILFHLKKSRPNYMNLNFKEFNS